MLRLLLNASVASMSKTKASAVVLPLLHHALQVLQKLEGDALLKSPQELLAVLQWVQQHVTAVELLPGMAGDLFFDPSGRLYFLYSMESTAATAPAAANQPAPQAMHTLFLFPLHVCCCSPTSHDHPVS
jgi:hypothetical protein